MKNYKRTLTAIAICLACISLSCQKEKLPKLTQEGKNTFGCNINGKNWVPSGGGGFSGIEPVDGGYLATYDFNTTSNNVRVTGYDKSEIVELYIREVKKSGVYLLNSNTLDFTNIRNPQNYGYYQTENGNKFITTPVYSGKVNVTHADTVNKIVSDTFEFTAVDNTGNTVKITDGRFDIKTH